MSTSGETYTPKNSASSPVLTMIEMSSGGIARFRPSRNFEAPTPPARAVIIVLFLSEQIVFLRANQLSCAARGRFILITAYHYDRDAGGLLHQQTRCRGEFVRDGQHSG